MIRSFEDLRVYQFSLSLAQQVFTVTSRFPKEETCSLTSQLRRSSRSIPANIAEGWGKRHFVNVFRRHLTDAIGSCDETKAWLSMALSCGYVGHTTHDELRAGCMEVSGMLFALRQNWRESG